VVLGGGELLPQIFVPRKLGDSMQISPILAKVKMA